MLTRTFLLMTVAAFCCAGADDESRHFRRPWCEASGSRACPLDFSPVCGSDGVTYANECSLCVTMMEKNADILIVMEGSC